MDLNFEHTTQVRVRYGETDQMGYCYYGNYAQFFEVGRVEAMRSLGMSYKEMEENGIMLPVNEFTVKYFKPAYYDDLLTIKTIIHPAQGARLKFDYILTNEAQEVVAEASTTLVFVDKLSMRPRKAPDKFIQLMKTIHQ